jgi:ABC-type multidrug transport system fused ATPase/permease subunit
MAFLSGVVGPVYQYVGMIIVIAALFTIRSFDLVEASVLGAMALLLLRGVSYGQRLQSSYHTVAEAMPTLERLDASQQIFRAHAEERGGQDMPAIEIVECAGVSYAYGDDVPALADVSFSFPTGSIVGIVGPSGSGKSTLAQILLRLRRPDSGQLLVNGVDASEYALDSWYRHVTLVPQDPELLHGTVRENVSFFDASMTQAAIEEAAAAAGIHELITALPQGYETMVGRAVHDLSGGQIQRIGIARALARSADVIVLDEPSSALDVHSEAIVQATLRSLQGKKLVFIIAHRLSTLSICDHLVVLDAGRVTAQGPAREVIDTSPFFQQAMKLGTLDVQTPTGS